MKHLLIGGPRHGETIDVRGPVPVVRFPTRATHSAGWRYDNDDLAIRQPLYSVAEYTRTRFGLPGRNEIAVYVCRSDVSEKTAESYIWDCLARSWSSYVDSVPAA